MAHFNIEFLPTYFFASAKYSITIIWSVARRPHCQFVHCFESRKVYALRTATTTNKRRHLKMRFLFEHVSERTNPHSSIMCATQYKIQVNFKSDGLLLFLDVFLSDSTHASLFLFPPSQCSSPSNLSFCIILILHILWVLSCYSRVEWTDTHSFIHS